jgi:hypothetical protein
MAWVQRGERRYYYRTLWINGAPRKIYMGTEDVGAKAAEDDAQRRRVRLLEQQQLAAKLEKLSEDIASADVYGDQAGLLIRAALVAAGFHQHARGKWRKRRENRGTNE